MDDRFTKPDFEEFLQNQVRNHRMYPSDGVWKEINKKLHGEKKWPGLTIAALLLFTATLFTCIYFTPKPSIFNSTPTASRLNSGSSSSNDLLLNLTTSPFRSAHKEEKSLAVAEVTPPVTTAENPKTTNEVNTAIVTTANHSATARKVKSDHIEKSVVIAEAIQPQTASEAVKNELTYENKLPAKDTRKPATELASTSKDYNDKNMVDQFLKDHKEDIALYTTSRLKSLKNNFSIQFYVAPSISYRNLVEDRSVLKGNTTGPVGVNYVTDVNKIVRHKPGTGLEIGANLLYNMTDKFRIKTGLQFNVRQYNIEAYRAGTELTSITLVGNNRIDTISSLAIYRTNNGYYSDELVNRYYQLSIPLGIELQVIGNRHVQLNVSGSIQPTYLLNRNAYLLSTNFKNYTEQPNMVRSFNINSNIETFVSIISGEYKWQLGPQIRYQPYSTFISSYPIKEHLMDYGFKVGVSKVIK